MKFHMCTYTCVCSTGCQCYSKPTLLFCQLYCQCAFETNRGIELMELFTLLYGMHTFTRMYLCMYTCMHACVFVNLMCMYAWLHVHMYVHTVNSH